MTRAQEKLVLNEDISMLIFKYKRPAVIALRIRQELDMSSGCSICGADQRGDSDDGGRADGGSEVPAGGSTWRPALRRWKLCATVSRDRHVTGHPLRKGVALTSASSSSGYDGALGGRSASHVLPTAHLRVCCEYCLPRVVPGRPNIRPSGLESFWGPKILPPASP